MAVSGQRTPGSSIETAEIADLAVTTGKIADDAVTLAKMAEMATDSFIGRDTAGTGNPEVLSAATAATILGGLIATLATQTATVAHSVVTQTLSAATVTIDLSAGNIQRIVMDQNLTTVTITRGTPGKTVVVHFVGSYTATGWTTVDQWIPSGAPTFSGASNYVTFSFDGTTLVGQHGVAG